VRATKDHAAIRSRFEKRLLDGIDTRPTKPTECSKEVVGNCPELERWLFLDLWRGGVGRKRQTEMSGGALISSTIQASSNPVECYLLRSKMR